MDAEIKKDQNAVEFWTDERCWIKETANDQGDEMVSIARARVEPGVITHWHQLTGIAERYIVVSGCGRVQIGDADPVDVEPGDVVRIPAGMPQRIENIGSQDLVFYAICSPRFRSGCYVPLEGQRR